MYQLSKKTEKGWCWKFQKKKENKNVSPLHLELCWKAQVRNDWSVVCSETTQGKTEMVWVPRNTCDINTDIICVPRQYMYFMQERDAYLSNITLPKFGWILHHFVQCGWLCCVEVDSCAVHNCAPSIIINVKTFITVTVIIPPYNFGYEF